MLITKIRKKTHYIIWGFAGIFVVSIFYMFGMDVIGGGNQTSRGKSKIPKEVLSVDGKKIETAQFFHKYLQFKMQMESYEQGSFNTYPMRMYLQTMVVDFFINQEIFLQEARKRGVGADSAEISKRLNQYMDMLVGPSDKSKDPSVQARAKNFFAQKEREKQFRETLVRQGFSYDLLKESIRRDVTQEKAVQKIGQDMMKDEKKKAREKAASIVEKLQTGEPFQNLAREFSEDESTKYNGGDLGWIKHGTLIPEFEKLAFAMQAGQISQPVETPMGLHIILCMNKIEASGPDFEEQKPDIIARIREDKGDETAEVTDKEIRMAYEQVHVKHILIKVKTDRELAQEWVKREREKGTHKVEVINPELKAYRYLSKPMMDPGAGEIDHDEALDLYKKAIDVDPNNPYLYYQVGTIYERKNMKAQMATLTAESGSDELDPYAQAMAEAGDEVEEEAAAEEVTGEEAAAPDETATGEISPVGIVGGEEKQETDDKIFLPEALEAYLKATEIAEEERKYDALLFIAAGRTAKELGKNEIAVKNYVTAVDYAPSEKAYLEQVVEALREFDDEKAVAALAEAEETLTDIEAAEAAVNMPDDAMQFQIDEAGDGEPLETLEEDEKEAPEQEAAVKEELEVEIQEVEEVIEDVEAPADMIPIQATPMIDETVDDTELPAAAPTP